MLGSIDLWRILKMVRNVDNLDRAAPRHERIDQIDTRRPFAKPNADEQDIDARKTARSQIAGCQKHDIGNILNI